jgi:hypothetical protein
MFLWDDTKFATRFFFFFFSSTTLCEFWLSQLSLSIGSSLAPRYPFNYVFYSVIGAGVAQSLLRIDYGIRIPTNTKDFSLLKTTKFQ